MPNKTIKIFTLLCALLVFTSLLLTVIFPDNALATATPESSVSSAKFKLLNMSERSYDGQPAISLLFSKVLDEGIDYSQYLIVRDMNNRRNIHGGWIMSDDARRLYFTNIHPRLRYTVTISAQLLAKSGHSLKKEINKTLTTRTISPAYGFASKGSVLPSKLSAGLPLMSVNIDAVEIDFFHIEPDNILQFLREFSLSSSTTRAYALNRINNLGKLAYSGRFAITAKENQQVVTNIDVQAIDALNKSGLYAAILRQPGHYDYSYNATWFVISDLGVHVRRYRKSIAVFSAALATGKAIADVELLLLDHKGTPIAKTRADAHGQASLLLAADAKPMILLATHRTAKSKELAIVDFRTPALDLAEFSIAGRPWQAEELFIYAGRDIYRPGETANISALLRDDDGQPITKRPLAVKVLRADGKLYMEYQWQAQTSGYYHSEIYIDPDAPTGLWRVEVRNHPKQNKPLQVYKFKVEEFMPERMRLTLTPKQDILPLGQALQIKVEGMYLYGSPAGGNRLQAKITQQSIRQPLASLPGFIMGRQEDSELREQRELDSVNLDEQGIVNIDATPLLINVQSPMRFKLRASLFETGGRPVTRSTSVLIWPQKTLPAIRPLMNKSHYYNYDDNTQATRWIADVNSKASFELLLTNAQGIEQNGKVTVNLIREERYYYWTHSHNGWRRNFNGQEYSVDTQQIKLTASKRTKLHLPVEYGSYRLEVITENGSMSSLRFYAGWSWEDTGQVGYRPDRVNLELDKKSYAAGDIAKLTVRPPHAGLGVLTVEHGDALLMVKRIKLPKGESVINIPISKAWQRHDIYINLTLMRPGNKLELITPSRAVGLLHLPLARKNQQLTVKIIAPELTKPLTNMYANIQVSTANGDAPIGQTYVTLYATDEGILQVTDFATPNPWQYFFAKRAYSVDNRDMYGRIMDLLAGNKGMLRFGGDAAARLRGRATMKLDMLALYSGMVQLDVYGMVRIPLKLPWFNGQVRLMATAFNDTQSGSSEHKTTVAAPIITEVSLPRFLAMGDSSTMSLEVRNTQKYAADVLIDFYTTAPLQTSNSHHTLHLAAGARQNIKLPLQTTDQAGIAYIRFVLQSKKAGRSGNNNRAYDNHLTRTQQLTIRPAWSILRQRTRQSIAAAKMWQWQLSKQVTLMPASSSLTLSLSPTPPLDTYAALKDLVQYPYGCLEQTSSRLLPLLFADVLHFSQHLRIGNHQLIDETNRVKAVQAGLLRLAGFQLENGAFNLWGNRGDEQLWLSSFVTDVLLQARDQGFSVPKTLLDKAIERLDQRLRSGYMPKPNYYRSDVAANITFATNAYGAYVLASQGLANIGVVRRLYDRRKVARTPLALAHLAVALHLLHDKTRATTAIKEAIAMQRNNNYWGDYGSNVRDLGMIITLLAKYDWQQKIRDRLLFKLSDAVSKRQYFSTQERLAIYLASRTFAQNNKLHAALTRKAANTTIQTNGVWREQWQQAATQYNIIVKNLGDTPIFAYSEYNGFTKKAPAASSMGISITRNWYSEDGTQLDAKAAKSIKSGTLLYILLHVTTMTNNNDHNNYGNADRIPDALVVDLLPAGFEIENWNLTHSAGGDDDTITLAQQKYKRNPKAVRHSEYRDDRFAAALNLQGSADLVYAVRAVTPGQYIVPPPLAEDMYRPELHAIGETFSKVIVE